MDMCELKRIITEYQKKLEWGKRTERLTEGIGMEEVVFVNLCSSVLTSASTSSLKFFS